MNEQTRGESPGAFHMGGPTVTIQQSGTGVRKVVNGYGPLLLPPGVGVTEADRKAVAAFDAEAAILKVVESFGFAGATCANHLCELLQASVEDLSLVEQLPMIVPLSAKPMTEQLAAECAASLRNADISALRRLLPVIARCTSKAFIRSQIPIYTPAVLSRCVALEVPNSWQQKGQNS